MKSGTRVPHIAAVAGNSFISAEHQSRPDPLRDRFGGKRTPVLALFVLVSTALAVLVGCEWNHLFTQADVDWYLRIAEGKSTTVIQPYVVRQLGPLICRALTAIFPITVYTAFIVEGVISLLVLLGAVGYLILRTGDSALMLAAIGGLAFWAGLFNGLALPDLWFAGLLSVLLILLEKEHYLASALMLFILFFSRESTILVLFCLLVAGWRRMRPLHLILAIVSSLAGMQLVKHLTEGSLSNREQLSPLLYMAGKVPWNFMKNILGLPLWSNVIRDCATPQWQTSLHLGGITSVGVCAYQPAYTVLTLILALSSFGMLPLLLLYFWKRKPDSLLTQSVMIRFCVIYGTLSFLLAPALGASIGRLFGYAWPLFVVAVPIIAVRHLNIPRNNALTLLILHLAVSWSVIITRSATLSLAAEFILLTAIVGAYIGGWNLLRQGKLV